MIQKNFAVPKVVSKILTRYDSKPFVCCITYHPKKDLNKVLAVNSIFDSNQILPSQILTPAIYLCASSSVLFISKKIITESKQLQYQLKNLKKTGKALQINVIIRHV